MEGVAVCLKQFLTCLDESNIPHVSEKDIHRYRRKTPSCKSRMKQFFASDDGSSGVVDHKTPNASECKTCIGFPKGKVPSTFFDMAVEGL